MLTIIMYHYVRDLPRTRYPRIKGLLTEKFEGQLDYITKHYTVCSLGQIISAIRGEDRLPSNSCLLTFDDGFIDHYLTVFPRLEERGIVGSFYPPARAVGEHKVLHVHKIQFILASTGGHRKLVEEILGLVKRYRGEYDIPEDERLYKMYATQKRYDPPEVVFIKRILQRGLPERVRLDVVDNLFMRYVSDDEETFAKDLYMDIPQLRCMVRHGMEIGGHGYKHVWLETLPRSEQEEEIRRTVDFLAKIYGHKPSNWGMCYPHGSYNDVTIGLLNQAGCALGLTTRVGLVSNSSKPLELNRLDTNDIPFSGDAGICEWTRKAQQEGSDTSAPHNTAEAPLRFGQSATDDRKADYLLTGMRVSEKVLAVIPARGGSKGVPRKNIRRVCGKPLIAYTIETALAARHLFHRVIVSTDDDEIADVARRYGAEVPFMRPAELAGDEAPTVPVIQHTVQFVEQQDDFKLDWVFLLQPTAPFRTVEDIEEALRLARAGGCDSVISVVQVFSVHPILMKRIENGQLLPYCMEEKEGTRRQDYDPPAYMRNGAIYLARRDVLMERNSMWGDAIRPCIMPPERSVGVDSELDLKLVELLMQQQLNTKS